MSASTAWLRGRFGEMLWLMMLLSVGCMEPQPTGGGDDDDDPPTPFTTPAGETPTPGDGFTPTPPDDGNVATPLPEANTGFYVLGSFPQDGAMAVPAILYLQVYLSEPWQGDLSLITAEVRGRRSGTVHPLGEPTLGEDGMSLGFPLELWSEDYSFTLHVEFAANDFLDATWPLIYEAEFSTGGVPCDATFNVFNALEIVTLGGNESLANELNRMLGQSETGYPTALFLVGIPETVYFPVEIFKSALAPVYATDGGLYSIYPDTGITSTLEYCSISPDGHYACFAERAVFPLKLYTTTTLYLYLEDVELSGQLEASGNLESLTDFELSGYMLGTDLYLLLASVGYDHFAESVEFDVDSDGDGLNDASSVLMRSDPVPIDLAQCY